MIRAALTPPWVTMSETALPESWADARKIILANAPWSLLLVAIERAFEGHYYQAASAFGLCIISLGIAINWKAFEGLTKPEGRRRLSFILIIIGALTLAAGIYLLASQPTATTTTTSVPAVVGIPQSYEDGIIERTKKLQAPEKEGLARALVAFSSVYDQAKTVSDMFNSEIHLWNVGIDNGRMKDAIPANLDRLKQLRKALDECDVTAAKAENDHRYFDEQVGYVALRGQNPIADFRIAIDAAGEALSMWAKIDNKDDNGMLILLHPPLNRLRDAGAKFIGWIGQGTRRVEVLKTANRS
jgi:hypothetical protein